MHIQRHQAQNGFSSFVLFDDVPREPTASHKYASITEEIRTTLAKLTKCECGEDKVTPLL